ncbi:MAG: hypothetical protein ACP5OB_04785 [Candidatus Ratteibacteria bacterium]
MGKLLLKKLIRVFSIFIIFTSCYLSKNFQGNKRIYFEKIENFSNQPNLTFVLNEKIRELIIKYPEFNISNNEKFSDYIADLKILKFERKPLFYSNENSDDIVGAEFQIEVRLILKENGVIITDKNLVEKFSTSIFRIYNEEEVLDKISERIAKKIYFEILKIKK